MACAYEYKPTLRHKCKHVNSHTLTSANACRYTDMSAVVGCFCCLHCRPTCVHATKKKNVVERDDNLFQKCLATRPVNQRQAQAPPHNHTTTSTSTGISNSNGKQMQRTKPSTMTTATTSWLCAKLKQQRNFCNNSNTSTAAITTAAKLN